MRTRQLESCQVVVKPGRFPGVGIVAGFAILAKGPIMMIIASVTGIAVHWCALEDIVQVAALTQRITMRTSQLKDRTVVVKIGRLPSLGTMTTFTLLTQAALVRIIIDVTAVTARRCTLEDIIKVAALAQHIDMSAGQLKERQVVVKIGRFPGLGGMAVIALGSQGAIMRIVRLVAANTVARCSLENVVNMALFTGHTLMLPGQLEDGQVVVKRSRCPACCSMAYPAVLAKGPVVMIVLLMAGETIGRCTLKHIIDVTFFACGSFMLAG